MEKEVPPSLFINDGSFMERFKQLQQLENSKQIKVVAGCLSPNPSISNTPVDSKANDMPKTSQAGSGGKLAFSLKQKSKLVPPTVKLGVDEDEEEIDAGDVSNDAPPKQQKLGQEDGSEQSRQLDFAPPSPSDPTVKKVADKLASFVAKNGRKFEDVTRQKNLGDAPFKFLFDERCADFKYYEYRLAQEEKALLQSRESQVSRNGSTSTSSSKQTNSLQRPSQQHSTYKIPASAYYMEMLMI